MCGQPGGNPRPMTRIDRRLGARLSRAQNVVGYVAVPVQRTVRRAAVFLYIAAFFEDALFCRVAAHGQETSRMVTRSQWCGPTAGASSCASWCAQNADTLERSTAGRSRGTGEGRSFSSEDGCERVT